MNSRVCIDASLLIWALVPYPLSANARALLATWQQSQATLIAPALLAFEVTASLRRFVYLREITPRRAKRHLPVSAVYGTSFPPQGPLSPGLATG